MRSDFSHYQIIVVDNNSPNNSLQYLTAWADGQMDVYIPPRHPLRGLTYPPVKKPLPYLCYTKEEAEKGGDSALENKLSNPLVFIQSGCNGGFAFANNIGIKYALAKGDFDSLILLNNDTVVRRDTISRIVDAKFNHGDAAIYGGRIFYYAKTDKLWYDGGHFDEWSGRAIHVNMDKTLNDVETLDSSIKPVNFITFCFVLIPRFILEEVGLLDDSYFMYLEDLDYSYRVWKKGYKLYHLADAVLWHKVGQSSGGDFSPLSQYWGMRSRVKFFNTHLPFLKKISSLCFFILSRPLSWLRFKNFAIVKSQIMGIIDAFILTK